MTKPKRIRDTSKKAPRIRDTSPSQPLVDPQFVARALGAEIVKSEDVGSPLARLVLARLKPNGHGQPIKARRFYLFRSEDVSGVSGTGKVAEGVEFENGMCALSFSSQYQHANVYANIRAVMEVHGHQGKTQVVYVDGTV
jgi:hypothetical protein